MVDAGWVMDVVDALGGSWDDNPDRFTYPTGDKLPVCPHFAKASPLRGRRVCVGSVACYRYADPLGLKTQAAT